MFTVFTFNDRVSSLIMRNSTLQWVIFVRFFYFNNCSTKCINLNRTEPPKKYIKNCIRVCNFYLKVNIFLTKSFTTRISCPFIIWKLSFPSYIYITLAWREVGWFTTTEEGVHCMSISFSCRNWHRVINAQKSTETYCEGNIRLTTSRLANKRPWSAS